MTVDEKLFDEVINQSLNIFRLSAKKRAETVKRLDEMAKALIEQLGTAELNQASRSKIKKVIKQSEEIIADYYNRVQGELELRAVSETVAARTARSLEIVMDWLQVASLPRQDYFKSLASNVLIQGSPARDWWRGQALSMQRRFAAALRTGLANSETNQQLVQRIVGKNGEPGIMDKTRLEASNLVHTSVQAVANDARRKTFEANSDVIKGFRQVSTLDGHTSIVCISYSGASWNMKKEPLDGSPPWNGGTPRHFLCRSVETPITKTFREMGIDIDEPEPTTRASSEGQIDAKTSFNDFLKRRGQAYQDEMLGVGRADLWRKGKITLRDLVNGDGRPLSLEELRQRFA